MRMRDVLGNAGWIVGCRTVQSLLQLVVGMLCARYLGPGGYGLLQYAAAVVAFALPVMRLGFQETLVREFLEEPEAAGQILGTALGMNLLSGLASMAAVWAFAAAANPGRGETVLVCVLCSLSLVFGAGDMIRCWFQHRLLAKESSLALLGAFCLVSGYRLWLLASGKPVTWFALTHALEYALVGGILLLRFLARGFRLTFSRERAGAMLRRSSPYIAASLLVVAFQSTDRIMLTALCGSRETGIYSAAVTCVTMGQFVYVAIVDSFRPLILSRKKAGTADFPTTVSHLYGIIGCLAAAQGLVFAVLARPLVGLLFGPAYLEAVPVLRILGGYFFFSCMGLVRNVWILAQQEQKYLWLLNLAGAAVNIGLNLWWIPLAGARGAAFASLVTQLTANALLGFGIPALRPGSILMLRGLSPAHVRRGAGQLLDMIKNKSYGRDSDAKHNAPGP